MRMRCIMLDIPATQLMRRLCFLEGICRSLFRVGAIRIEQAYFSGPLRELTDCIKKRSIYLDYFLMRTTIVEISTQLRSESRPPL